MDRVVDEESKSANPASKWPGRKQSLKCSIAVVLDDRSAVVEVERPPKAVQIWKRGEQSKQKDCFHACGKLDWLMRIPFHARISKVGRSGTWTATPYWLLAG